MVVAKRSSSETRELGLTASITQTQGNGPLTAQMNVIVTVANPNDVRTLPLCKAGDKITLINKGANTLQVFPALNDDLGNGVNVSTILPMNEELTFFGTSNTHWHIKDTTEIFHGELHDINNTVPFGIDAINEAHAYISDSITAGDLDGWTFHNGKHVSITSIADAGGGNLLVTTSADHTLSVGDVISQNGVTDAAYLGFKTILTVPLSTTYTVAGTFGVTRTGFMHLPSHLKINDIAIGKYLVLWKGTATCAANNTIYEFHLHNGVNSIPGSEATQKLAVGADFNTFGGFGILDVNSGDEVFLSITCTSGATDITFKSFSIVPVKL